MKDVARTLLQAMDAIGDAFYLLDKEWRFVFVNAEASRLMNRPAGSLVNKVVWDEFPPARDSIFGREMFRAVATGHAIEFTARYGPLKRWFDVRLHPTDGGLAVAFSDADLRIEVEQLRELEARLTANVLAGAGLPSLFAVAIEIVRGAAEWAVGEAWLARADGKWELAAIDIADDEQLRRFAAHSRTISLHATEGLPGAAISRGDMIDFQALGVAEGFVRHEAAREAGLVAGVALPIIDHGKALGVLVFLNRQPLADDSWWHLLAPISERVTELARRERGLTLVDQFFELSIEGLAIGDATGRLVRVNPALCEMLGTTEAELIASRFETMIHPDDLPHTLEALELVQAGQRVVEYENRVRHGAGGWRRITWSSRIDPVEGALHATARDVTEVRRREALEDVQRDVLESLARDDTLAAILAKVVTAIEVMAPGSRAAAMLVRDGAVWLGAAPSLPTAYSTALHGARIGPAAGSCGTAAWRDEMVIVTDIANDPLWAAYRDLADTCGLVACWSIPFHDASGTVIGTLAVYPPGPELPSVVELDGVTALARIAAIAVERRRVDDELHLLRSAVEHLNDVVMITESEPLDAPGPRIQFVNEAFERMTGYTRAEAIGQSPRMLHGPTTDPAALGRIKAALQSALPIREEVTNYSRTGEPYTVEVDIAPVINREGLVTHFVSIQRDVTERRSLEEQLRESQKLEAVGRLAGGVAHDFNNMLTAIQGFAELLMLDTTDAESREHVAEIIRSARRASDLTRKLLAFSRRQVLQPQVVDLSALVGELTPLLERLVGEAVIHDVQLAADPLPVLADPGQIEQALVNLVLNSRDAMPDGGRITITTAPQSVTDAPAASAAGLPPGEYVCVSVEDNGVGMSAEVRGRIFEPFFTTKGDRGGTGLGLPSVLGIVQQSGGRLTVVSAAGDGTKVTILLPRAGAESVSPLPARSSSAARPTRAATIMVVEDEEQLRELIRRMLERAGYTVLTTGDAEAAEPMAEQYDGAIDLLLTDVVLPRLNGRLVAEAVSRHRPGIQVLFMSGYTEDAIVHHGVLDEGIAFLGKPFTRDDLLDQIATMLSSAEG